MPIPRYCKVDNLQDLRQAIDMLGLPLMIKSRYDSYDGKGNLKLSCESQIDEVFERFKHGKLLAQEFIKFSDEVSVVCVGLKNGDTYIPCLIEQTWRRLSYSSQNINASSSKLRFKRTSNNHCKSDIKNYLKALVYSQ